MNTSFELKKITVPTLVIYGDKDPYLNFDRVNAVLDDLPDGSVLEVIEGASHVVFIEKPYYHDFQNRLIKFLRGAGHSVKQYKTKYKLVFCFKVIYLQLCRYL